LKNHNEGHVGLVIRWVPDHNDWCRSVHKGKIEWCSSDERVLEVNESVDDFLINEKPLFPHGLSPQNQSRVSNCLLIPLLPRKIE